MVDTTRIGIPGPAFNSITGCGYIPPSSLYTSQQLHIIHPTILTGCGLWVHLTIFVLYIPLASQIDTADANKLHAFRDLRSSLVVSSLHILNLPLFLAQQAALNQTYILVSSHQQSVTAGNMSSVPNFFPLVLVSSLLAKLKL